MNDFDFVSNYLNTLMLGNPSIITDSNNARLNQIALNLYEKAKVSSLSIEDNELLKKIIYICNILYNRTDMSIPVISDGFYDLLNEVYKRYDPNFQVGSMVIQFKEHFVNDANNKVIGTRTPIHIRNNNVAHKDELHEEIFNKISRFYPLNQKDFIPTLPLIDNGNISKRTHDTGHNHPSLVGTLDKAKFVLNSDAIKAGVFNDSNVKVLERDFFQDHINRGIINPYDEIEVICELKYDGISIEADCTDRVISARSRGDTGIGQASDMTPILKDYLFKQAVGVMSDKEPIGVKFEAIVTNSNLGLFNQMRMQDGIDPYKNGRTAIVGLFGSGEGYKYRDLITLVPLAVDRDNCPYINNRLEEIEFLNRLYATQGNKLRYAYFKGNLTEILYYIKAFVDEANIARNYLDFMYDGIVVSYLNEDIRNKLGRENYINKYSMAVKFDPQTKETVFRGYTFTVGQNGQVTPMIHYDPVEFLGTIHTKSTGSSYDRFNELGFKYGDFISVSYVNDVMPYVSKLECDHNRSNPNPVFPFPTHCPICGSKLIISDSGKTAMCNNMYCPARSISRMTNMFAKLNIKGFAEATFKAIPEIDHFYKLFEYDINYYKDKLGEADGTNIYNILNNLLNSSIPDYIIVGALGFSGIARKKWQNILSYITLQDIYHIYEICPNQERFRQELLNCIPSLGDITSYVLSNEFEFFDKDIEMILKLPIINSYGDTKNSVEIRFSGCRNLQLSEQLCNLGYDADQNSSVTKNTKILLVPYTGFISNKVNKVSPDCLVIPINDFIDNMNEILSRFNK